MTPGPRDVKLPMQERCLTPFLNLRGEVETLELGIALALVCAVVTQLGFLCKHRGAGKAPLVQLRRPLASAKALMSSGWFAAGMGIAVGAWFLHVGAPALAPPPPPHGPPPTRVAVLAAP